MIFSPINMDTYVRREHFNQYFTNVPCTYSICVKLDISRIKLSGIQVYPAMIHGIATVVNRHAEFRMACDSNNVVGIYDVLNPCYTVFHKDTETFSNIWSEYSADYEAFQKNYQRDIEEYGDNHAFEAKPNTPENAFPISMIPWVSFEGFNLNLQKGYTYLLPIFTLGKYYEDNGKIWMPLSIQVHHAVCDGFHTCRFVNELQALLDG